MVTSQCTSIPEVATNVEQNLIQSETMDDDDTTRLGTKRPSSEISIGVPSEPVGKSPLMTVEDNNKSINSEDFLRDLKNTNKSNLNKEKTDLKKNNIPSLNDDSSHRRLIDRDSEHINLESDYDKDDMYALLPFHGEHKRAISCLAFKTSFNSNDVSTQNTIDHDDSDGSSDGNGRIQYEEPLRANSKSKRPATYALCASGSADGTVKIWDITQGIMEKGIAVMSCDKISTSRNLSTTNRSPSVIDSNSSKGTVEQNTTAAFHKTNGINSNADVINTTKSKPISPVVVLTGHTRGINDVAWSPRTGGFIATASDDKNLRLWDVVRSSSNSGGTSVGKTGGGTVKKWGGEALVEFKGHSNFCFSVNFSPMGNLIVSGSFDETIKLWDVRSGECVSTLPAHSDPVTGVDFNHDGNCIVSASHDGLIRVWDVATGECLKTIYAPGNPPVSFVRYSPNGKFVLSATLDAKLRLWNAGHKFQNNKVNPAATAVCNNGLPVVKGGKCIKTYTGHINSKYCIFSDFAIANPRCQSIISGSEDNKIYVYDLQKRNIRQVLEGHSDAVLAVAAHRTRNIFASGGMSNDRTVRFWIPNQ